MADESDLRRKIKKVFGVDLKWVEPNVRNTVGAGIPDCEIKIGKTNIPIELKYWKMTKKGLDCKMRPAQIRYHVMGSRDGKKSAILFASDVIGSAGEFYMCLVPNSKCPKYPYKLHAKDFRLVGFLCDDNKAVKQNIISTLLDREFWE